MTLGVDQAALDALGEPPPIIRILMDKLGLDPETMFEQRIGAVGTLREPAYAWSPGSTPAPRRRNPTAAPGAPCTTW